MQASTQLQLSQLNLTTEQLHTFLHLTTQAPLESVCRSSLYVLANVPAGRQGVLEYLSTFYKVATFLHLRYQINLKNSGSSSSVDLTTEANSLVQINQAIEIIETELGELLSKRANDLWSLEIIRWLADMLGDIVHNTATTCADSMQGLSSEEIAAFKSPTINDGLEIWSKQCKPVQSFLNLILKTYTTSTNVETKSQIIDILFETSSKYPKKYDWALAYFSCLDIKVFLSKLFDLKYKELFSTTTTTTKQKQTAPQRCNVVNFVAKSYPKFTYEQIVGFLDNKEEDDNRKVMFLLRLAAHSPNLFTVLLNQLLNSSSPVLSHALVKLLDHDESRSKDELFNCLNQLSNSIAVFEILSNLLDLVSLEIRPINGDYYKKICHYSIQYIDELISSIYKTKSLEGTGNQSASESMGFLKSLNQINGYSYQSLVKSLMGTLKNLVASEPTKWPNNELELAYKLTLLMMINTNEYKAGVIMREMLTIDESSASSSKSSHSLDENVLVKIRQEVGSFHSMCFGDSVKSLVNFFATVDVDEDKLSALVGNLVLAYDWDIQNKCSMNQNVSNILLDRECFVGLMKLLKPGENYSLKIMELYNRIFKHDDEDPNTVKLTINDLIQCSHLFVAYFFDLTKSVDETNVANKVKEINEMLTLLENTVFQQFNSLDENNPYRNILLRNLIEKLLESLVASEPQESSSQLDLFDENSNLFTSNIESISSELITNKSRLKAVRNSLISSDSIKRNRLQIKNQFKSFRNLALVEFIEVICKTDDGRRMSSEQLTNLADLLVQNILLEQHFVDYQWSSSSSSSAAPNLIDIEESFESELESIKLFVERDMSVQNKVENHVDNQIIWILLELIASDEQAFIRAGPIIRSLLSSVIIQWESLQETPTRNNPKTLGITIRLLNIINRVPNFLNKPLCYIVDIVPFINSYETFIALMIIWRNLKRKMTLKPAVMIEPNRTSSDIKHLRYIFQKNMSKLACLYAKFFKI